jgi:hypothetical protein
MGWTKSLFEDFGDQVLLLVLALAMCAFVCASFWIAEEHHLNEVWVFVGWNSLTLVPLFIKKFRTYLKRPAFILFSIVWMIFHGLFVVGLMRWVPLFYWPVLLLLEFLIGGVAANRLFGAVPSDDSLDDWRLTKVKDSVKEMSKTEKTGDRNV